MMLHPRPMRGASSRIPLADLGLDGFEQPRACLDARGVTSLAEALAEPPMD